MVGVGEGVPEPVPEQVPEYSAARTLVSQRGRIERWNYPKGFGKSRCPAVSFHMQSAYKQ